jgi:hypothetical protein
MPDGLVRWPARPVTPGRVAVITVSHSTRELTALLLWSLRRILAWDRSSLFTVWASDDTTHPDHWWARDHHEPHFALVDGAAARHDDLLRAFRADVGPLDDPKAVKALTVPA